MLTATQLVKRLIALIPPKGLHLTSHLMANPTPRGNRRGKCKFELRRRLGDGDRGRRW